MIRYAIQMRKPGTMLPVTLCDRAVATTGTKAELILYVRNENTKAFEKLVEGSEDVLSYTAHPVDLKTSLAVSARGTHHGLLG